MAGDLESKGFIRRGNALIPADWIAEEWLQALPEGKELLISHRSPRHGPNHRHLFAILRLATEQLDAYSDEDSLLDMIKVACGHTRPVMMADGKVLFLPKSINFASLGEEAFKRFKDRALFVLSRILGYDATTLLPEIEARNARVNAPMDMDERPSPPTETYEG